MSAAHGLRITQAVEGNWDGAASTANPPSTREVLGDAFKSADNKPDTEHAFHNSDAHSAVTSVSFIIPALNEEKHIERCLKSIQQQVLPSGINSIDIVVVDNHSSDRTAEISRAMGARVVEVPPGRPSRARNAGVRSTSGQLLAFIDADCELDRHWLELCIAQLKENRQAVAAAGVTATPSAASNWVERACYHLTNGAQSQEPKHVRWLPTFNLLVRRAAFECVGGFDESLETCEDCDLGYKLFETGTLVLEPRTYAAHHGESRSLSEVFRREAWRSNGNLRLALRRPRDWSNWLSLLAPPVLVFGFCVSLTGILVALILNRSVWPWITVQVAVVITVTLLVVRKTKRFSPRALVPQCAVYATYLAGRSVGLLSTFRRVDR